MRMNSMWSLGAHYEHLLTTRDSSAPGAAQDYYRWIGPYVEMKLPGNMAFRFTVGKDLTDNQDFYKLKFTKTFLSFRLGLLLLRCEGEAFRLSGTAEGGHGEGIGTAETVIVGAAAGLTLLMGLGGTPGGE